MALEFFVVIAGIILILALADVVIKSTIRLARHFGLTGTFVGLTILSIGTSIPEIMSAIIGSSNILKNPGIMNTISGLIVGQNVGSDIFQQSVVLGTAGIIGTIIVVKKNLNKEIGALILGALLVWLLALGGRLNRIEGVILLTAYAAYLIYLYTHRVHNHVPKRNRLTKRRLFLETTIVTFSFILMAFAADKVLDASTVLVETLPISASFFGVILLGVASALPELTTALVAILKKQSGISTGVLIGSNITNPLMGLGIGALISTYSIPKAVIYYDLPVKIGTALLIYYFLLRSQDLKKTEGLALILLFLVYLWARTIFFPVDF